MVRWCDGVVWDKTLTLVPTLTDSIFFILRDDLGSHVTETDDCAAGFVGAAYMPFIELLRRTKMAALARSADPWRLRLERVRGVIG